MGSSIQRPQHSDRDRQRAEDRARYSGRSHGRWVHPCVKWSTFLARESALRIAQQRISARSLIPLPIAYCLHIYIVAVTNPRSQRLQAICRGGNAEGGWGPKQVFRQNAGRVPHHHHHTHTHHAVFVSKMLDVTAEGLLWLHERTHTDFNLTCSVHEACFMRLFTYSHSLTVSLFSIVHTQCLQAKC